MTTSSGEISDVELSTILAALRYYQRAVIRGSDSIPRWTQEIATNERTLRPLNASGIDRLCEKLNLG